MKVETTFFLKIKIVNCVHLKGAWIVRVWKYVFYAMKVGITFWMEENVHYAQLMVVLIVKIRMFVFNANRIMTLRMIVNVQNLPFQLTKSSV